MTAPLVSQVKPLPTSPLDLRPTPDGAGGATVHLPASTTHAVLSGPDLHAIDLHADAALHTLDLSGCRSGPHLVLMPGAQPSHILLPQGEAGAVLHMDLDAPLTELKIDGAVDWLDLAWRDDEGLVCQVDVACRKRSPPFAGAWLGPLTDAVVPRGLLLITSGSAERFVLPRDAPVQHLGLFGCEVRGEMNVLCELDDLVLHDVSVTRVRVGKVRRATLSQCELLAEVDGTGAQLSIIGGCAPDGLRIMGYWKRAELWGVAARSLYCPAVRDLEVAAPEVREIVTLWAEATLNDERSVSLRGGRGAAVDGDRVVPVQPMRADDIFEAFNTEDQGARSGMVHWARLCDRPSDLWMALRVLAMAVDAGLDAADMWSHRCEIAARRGARGAARNRKNTWLWQFPEDLADRGWTADVRLWLRCVGREVPGAIAFAEVMATSHHPVHIAALLLTANGGDTSAAERDLLRTLATRGMRGAIAGEVRIDLLRQHRASAYEQAQTGLFAADQRWLQHAVSSVIAHAEEPGCNAIAAATLVDYLATCAPTELGVRLIGALRSHGCAGAGTALLRLEAELPQRAELSIDDRRALRRELLLQMIQPDIGPHFADPDSPVQTSETT